MIRHSVSRVSMSRKAGAWAESISGSEARPSSGSTFIPSVTGTMQLLSGRPSATTEHWAHWPLAQKMPIGALSLRWRPKMRTPLAKSAEAITSPRRAFICWPFQKKESSALPLTSRIGCCWMR